MFAILRSKNLVRFMASDYTFQFNLYDNCFMRTSIKHALLLLLLATGLVQGFFFILLGSSKDDLASMSINSDLISEIPVPASITPSNKEEPSLSQEFKHYLVKSGDTLTSIWNKLGGPTGGSEKVIAAMSEVGLRAKNIKAGEVIKYVQDQLGEIVEIHKVIELGKTLILRGDSRDGYTPLIHEPTVVSRDRPVIGTVERSFSEAALSLDIPYEIIDDYVDLFSGRVEFRRDLQPGDKFTLIYEENRLENGELLKPGRIVAATLGTAGKLNAAIKYKGADGEFRYFDEDGESLANAFLRYPLQFTRISSAFSTSRFHPVLKRSRPHNGVDFAAPTGTPVRAVADGVVLLAGWSGGGGKTVKMQHGSRYATAYLHLSAITPSVRKGSRVKRGQVIGKVGSTGLATGPHLHYSFYDRGKYVDPLKIKLPKLDVGPGAQIPKPYLAAAMKTLMHYHEG